MAHLSKKQIKALNYLAASPNGQNLPWLTYGRKVHRSTLESLWNRDLIAIENGQATITEAGLAAIGRGRDVFLSLGVQPVPNDPRIFNRVHENGNTPPLSAFFEGHKSMYDKEVIPAAKPESRAGDVQSD